MRTVSRPPPRRPLPCVHLGPVVEQLRCNCERRKLRQCDLHGRCTQDRVRPEVRSCEGCPDYAADG